MFFIMPIVFLFLKELNLLRSIISELLNAIRELVKQGNDSIPVTLSYNNWNWVSTAIYFQRLIPTSFHLFDNRFSVPAISALKIVSFFTNPDPYGNPISQAATPVKNDSSLDDIHYFFREKKTSIAALLILWRQLGHAPFAIKDD